MIRLLATLGSAALVIWGVGLALDTGSWREPVARVGAGVTGALDAVTETAQAMAREEFEPDLGQWEDAVELILPENLAPDSGGTASVPDPGPASASERSRHRADEIRSRLDRVMDLASGPSP